MLCFPPYSYCINITFYIFLNKHICELCNVLIYSIYIYKNSMEQKFDPSLNWMHGYHVEETASHLKRSPCHVTGCDLLRCSGLRMSYINIAELLELTCRALPASPGWMQGLQGFTSTLNFKEPHPQKPTCLFEILARNPLYSWSFAGAFLPFPFYEMRKCVSVKSTT